MPVHSSREGACAAELVYLRGSPWSLRVLWALSAANVQVERYTEHVPGPGELYLRLRLGKLLSAERITVPVLFKKSPNASHLFDSGDIAKWALGGRDSDDEGAPSGNECELDALVDKADVLCRFLRANMGACGDSAAAKLLPWPVSAIPGLRTAIAWAVSKWFSFKFQRDAAISRETCREALAFLDTVMATQECEKGGSLTGSGTLTYADMAVAIALECFDPAMDEGAVVISALTPKLVADMLRPMLSEYPRLVAWRRAAMKQLPEEAKRRSSMVGFLGGRTA